MESNLTSNSSNETATTAGPAVRVGQGPTETQLLIFKISLLIVSALAVTGNGLVIYFVLTKRRLRTKTNAMVVSLAFSDLFVGLALIPSFFACFYVKCDNQLSKLFYDVFLFTSVLNLCCITSDRFLAVTRPLKYHMSMTRRTVTVIITLSWVIPTIVCLIPIAWYYTDTGAEKIARNNKIFYTIQVVAFMFVPCLIMLSAYMIVFKIAWKHSRNIRHVVSTLSLSTTNSDQNQPSSVGTGKEAKATLKVFGTVVLMFIACWFLSAFRSIVTYYNLTSLNFELEMASRILLVANSAVNPIIYALWKRDIRKEFARLLRLNKQVRPTSSGTFRSIHEATSMNGGIARKPSAASSMGDSAMQVKNRQAAAISMIQVTEADNERSESMDSKDDIREAPLKPEQDSTIGIENLATEVDGMV